MLDVFFFGRQIYINIKGIRYTQKDYKKEIATKTNLVAVVTPDLP